MKLYSFRRPFAEVAPPGGNSFSYEISCKDC